MQATVNFKNAWDGDAVPFIDDFIENCLLKLNLELDSEKDSDLLNIRDEILGVVNQLKYLLKLN